MAQIINKTAISTAALLLALMLAAPHSTAHAQAVPQPEREQLLNGLTILYGNRPGDPNVLLKLRIKSGAAFDLAGKAGTMSLLADAMFPESTTREYVAEQLGGRLDVTTTYDSIDVTISGKSSELERMIEILRNGIINVNLSAESVAALRAERTKQLAEKSSSADAADRGVATRLFGSYPYGSPSQGTVETIAKIERADLMLERERFLNADNAALAVIGGVEKARVMRALRQLLGPWQKGDRIVPATFRQPGAVDDRVLVLDQESGKNVQIRLAVRGLSRSDPDARAASHLAQIANMRWQKAVPELSTTSLVRNDEYALGGMFMFAATVPATSANKTIAAARKIMTDLAESGPSEGEVPRTVVPPDWPSSPAVASVWLDAESYKVPANKLVEATPITAADMRRTAARLFANSAPLAIVVLGNAAELQTQLGYKVELRSNAPEPSKPEKTPLTTPKKP
ncbi:MAG TPA: insulinase family protein [Pyrinomonadaceae bacterium]|nr:insulinase family protein [Pyrinomonadaceae bacterium]